MSREAELHQSEPECKPDRDRSPAIENEAADWPRHDDTPSKKAKQDGATGSEVSPLL